MESSSLRGKVALVTGASDGMGKATSTYLASLGCIVALAARRVDVTKAVAEEVLKKYGAEALPIRMDVSSDADVQGGIETIIERFGRLDFIANFAGNPVGYATGDRRKAVHELPISHFKEIAEVDHFGSVRILKHALPHMIERKSGKIILISAITSVYGFSEDVDYIPYKRANEGLATSTALRSLREGWGIELYTLAPGDVFNPSTWNSYDEKERAEAVKYGVVHPTMIAKVVSWIFAGRLKRKYEMKVNIDSGEVLDDGRYSKLLNGDVVVVDAKTMPKIYQEMKEPYTPFVPEGY